MNDPFFSNLLFANAQLRYAFFCYIFIERKRMFNLTYAHFRDSYLYRFFQYGETHSKIPANLRKVLARKLDMINAAENLNDLRIPPANHLELLEPKENKMYSIRVNKQYRLIFKYDNNKLSHLYLDPHTYDL